MHHIARLAMLTVAVWLPLAHAQTREVPRPTSERAPFDTAVNALGMERGVRRDQTAINAIFFVAKGTLLDADSTQPVTRAVLSMSYFVPAIRIDVTRGAQRSIKVAARDVAWDEREPGVGATPANQPAAERLQWTWLTPHGAMRALVDARTKDKQAVTEGRVEGRTTFSATIAGGLLEVTVDATHRPQRVRWTIDTQVHEAEFSQYKDWELLDIYFPQRIVRRLDGRVVADLTVTDFRSNPYVVFPVPAKLRSKT